MLASYPLKYSCDLWIAYSWSTAQFVRRVDMPCHTWNSTNSCHNTAICIHNHSLRETDRNQTEHNFWIQKLCWSQNRNQKLYWSRNRSRNRTETTGVGIGIGIEMVCWTRNRSRNRWSGIEPRSDLHKCHVVVDMSLIWRCWYVVVDMSEFCLFAKCVWNERSKNNKIIRIEEAPLSFTQTTISQLLQLGRSSRRCNNAVITAVWHVWKYLF